MSCGCAVCRRARGDVEEALRPKPQGMNGHVVRVPTWVLAQVTNRDVIAVRISEVEGGVAAGRRIAETFWVQRGGEGPWIELRADA